MQQYKYGRSVWTNDSVIIELSLLDVEGTANGQLIAPQSPQTLCVFSSQRSSFFQVALFVSLRAIAFLFIYYLANALGANFKAKSTTTLHFIFALLLLCSSISRPILQIPEPTVALSRSLLHFPQNPQNPWWVMFLLQKRSLSHGSVSLVITPQGKPKFETHETEPPKKEKWKTKKRLKLQRKREKQKRKDANKRDPRRLGIKGKKKRQRFSNAEERIKYKLDRVYPKVSYVCCCMLAIMLCSKSLFMRHISYENPQRMTFVDDNVLIEEIKWKISCRTEF